MLLRSPALLRLAAPQLLASRPYPSLSPRAPGLRCYFPTSYCSPFLPHIPATSKNSEAAQNNQWETLTSEDGIGYNKTVMNIVKLQATDLLYF